MKKDKLTLCNSCNCMTKTCIGEGLDLRDNGHSGSKRCGKCGALKEKF